MKYTLLFFLSISNLLKQHTQKTEEIYLWYSKFKYYYFQQRCKHVKLLKNGSMLGANTTASSWRTTV